MNEIKDAFYCHINADSASGVKSKKTCYSKNWSGTFEKKTFFCSFLYLNYLYKIKTLCFWTKNIFMFLTVLKRTLTYTTDWTATSDHNMRWNKQWKASNKKVNAMRLRLESLLRTKYKNNIIEIKIIWEFEQKMEITTLVVRNKYQRHYNDFYPIMLWLA